MCKDTLKNGILKINTQILYAGRDGLMRKKILATLLCVCMVSTVLGCGGSAETATENADAAEATESADAAETSDSGVVELTVWAEEDNFEMLNVMIESFKQEYAGQAEFNITLGAQADGEVRNVVLGNVHEAADVFHFPDDQLNSLITGGVLSAVPNADEVKAANAEGAVAAASLNDVLYGYPMTADNGYFLYYDKNYLTEEDVKTMDGLLAAAGAAGKYMTMDLTSGWYMYSFFGNTGLDMGINDDGVTNHCNWNSTEGAVTGMHVGEAMVNIISNPAFKVAGDADLLAGAQDGSVVAGISGVWNAIAIKEAWGDNYGAVKLPTYTCNGQQIQMSSFKGYKMIGVNSYSDHLDWAHKLADWFTNEENQTLRFTMRNQGPANINAAASDEVAKVPAIAAIMEQSEYGVLQRVGNSYWDSCTQYVNTLIEKKPSGVDLQEALDNLHVGITASVAG